MAKSVDLLTLVEIYKTDKKLFDIFCDLKEISLKSQELECILAMLANFKDDSTLNNLRSYSVGYTIEQIGKEFDLLRIDNSKVINIELKSELNYESILEQSRRNYYYLKFIRKDILIVSYELTSNSFYKYNIENDELNLMPLNQFEMKISKIEEAIKDPSKVFIAKKYLVSPFNSTNEFLKSEYFLTNHQEDIMRSITRSNSRIFSIEGSAGTGKTLLVYHIAKLYFKSRYDVRIIHCGLLNDGQTLLLKHGYKIFPIKKVNDALSGISSNSIIVVDESQRMTDEQVDHIIKSIDQTNSKVIFSFDKMQVLSSWEENRNITEKILKFTDPNNYYKLKIKIRTNPKLGDFIFCLIDKKRIPKYSEYSEVVEYSYVRTFDLAKSFASTLMSKGWIIINPTASRFNPEIHDKYCLESAPSAHAVIGQEYDKVAIIIPNTYFYNDEGQLLFRDRSYYKAERMFYQAISRTRLKLHLIIVSNPIILERLLELKV